MRVGLVITDRILRGSVACLLESDPAVQVVARGRDRRAARRMAARGDIDVLLVELALWGANAAQALALVREVSMCTHVLVLTDRAARGMVSACLEAGAGGCLGLDCDPRNVAAAVAAIGQGRTRPSPGRAR